MFSVDFRFYNPIVPPFAKYVIFVSSLEIWWLQQSRVGC